MNMVSRRGFLGGAAAGLTVTTLGAFGFGGAELALADSVRPYKLSRTTETRNSCPYCSVSCGLLVYSLGDHSKNAKASVLHIEGDPDHPVNRGTLCPKGAALLDFVHAETRTKYPMVRKPGSDTLERVSWDYALDRIAHLLKEDRDKNFIQKSANGTTVNRWTRVGMLAASASTNETGFITYKWARNMGMLVLDNQARI